MESDNIKFGGGIPDHRSTHQIRVELRHQALTQPQLL